MMKGKSCTPEASKLLQWCPSKSKLKFTPYHRYQSKLLKLYEYISKLKLILTYFTDIQIKLNVKTVKFNTRHIYLKLDNSCMKFLK